MATTYDAQADISLSVRENRTVTLYPDSSDEQEAMRETLLAWGEDYADRSGTGYSGSEARGHVRYWGTTDDGEHWQIDVVHA